MGFISKILIPLKIYLIQDPGIDWNNFSVYYSHNTLEGRKITYICRNHSSCGYMLTKLEPSDGAADIVYWNQIQHCNIPSKRGLSAQLSKELEDLYLKGYRTYQQILLRRIELKQEDLPKGKILYALSKLRKKYERAPILTIGELKEADTETMAPILISEEDIDKPYVFSSEYPDSPGESRFRLLFSSKRLLRLAKCTENLHIDATYKITWNGFPLLIVGGSDANRVFFLHSTKMIAAA